MNKVAQVSQGLFVGWNIGNIIWYVLDVKSGQQLAIEALVTLAILLLILKFTRSI